MATLKSIKTRIGSVKNTQKITKAMKMVAAAKLRRAQEAVTGARPYAETLKKTVEDIYSKSSEKSTNPLFIPREKIKKIDMVVFSSNRGLCGSFNSGLLRKVHTFVKEQTFRGLEVNLHVIGKKGRDFFKARGVEVASVNTDWADTMPFEEVVKLSQEKFEGYVNGDFDELILVFNKFESALTQTTTFLKMLPLEVDKNEDDYGIDFIYEPSQAEILDEILPKYGATQVYRAHLESLASEMGARMSAMDSATTNASEMIGKLTLMYNRLRQAAITTELMDIVNGAESIK